MKKTNCFIWNVIWIALLVLSISGLRIQAASSVFPPPGLVSWWAADGNAKDIFGGSPAVLMNGVNYSAGTVGQAFDLDGTNSYVQTSLDAQPATMPYTTWEAWVYPKRLNFSGTQPILSINDGHDQRLFRIEPNSAKFSIYTGNGFWKPVNATANQWQHIAVVFSPTNILFYRNGVRYDYGSAPDVKAAVNPLTIGHGAADTGGYFQGMIDEVAIYNRVLSTSEIQALYDAGNAGKIKPALPTDVIYTSDFGVSVGPEWSVTNRSVTPVGLRPFLGQFGNRTAALTLSNLPTHTNLTVECDLFIINTWDGSPLNFGPDIWDLSVADGPTLLHTTFGNPGPPTPQAYPGTFPGSLYPPATGALEVDTLGYTREIVYHLSYTFAHVSNVLVLQFSATNLQAIIDESWGLEKVVITAGGPNVRFITLTNDAAFTTPTNLEIAVEASASTGTISHVQFIADNVLLGTLTNAPYTFIWSNAPGGLHVLKAQAVDDAGRTAVSSVVLKINGLLGEYFSNGTLSGASIQRIDPAIDFDWDRGAPMSGVATDQFSVRWTGEIEPGYSELYTFYTTVNDGVRLWVNGQRVVDEWLNGSARERSGVIQLEANRRYTIQLDYFEVTGAASVTLEWQSASQARQVVPATRVYPPLPGANRSPNAPVATAPGDAWAVNPLLDKALKTDFFSDPDAGQIQSAAEWEIWTVSPAELVWFCQSTDPALFLTNDLAHGLFTNSLAGQTALELGKDYRLRVRHQDNSGATNASGVWADRYFNTRPPAFSSPPPSYQATVGENVNLYQTATNISPWVTYHWFSNGVAIANATNADLFLPNVQLTSAAAYTVQAQNPAGSVTSAPAVLTVTGGLTVLAQSTFDSSGEGWTIYEDSSNPVTIKYGATAGNSGGGIYGVENAGNGGTWYFVASSNYFGNKSSAYGGYLEFHQRRTRVDQLYGNADVVLYGAGLRLVINAPYPGLDWTHMRVPLHETSGWKRGALDGPPATDLDLLRVLASLTNLWIRGEYNVNADSCYMDNVRLLAPECTPGTILKTRHAPNQVILEWPTNACGFQLESSGTLSAGWTNDAAAQTALLSNGLYTVTLDLTNAGRFYRLKKP